MRHLAKLSIVLTVLLACIASSHATYFGVPRTLNKQIERIQLATPTLSPLAHTRHCMQYPDECRVHRMAFRGGPIKLNGTRWAQLTEVNRRVNRAISPEPNTGGVMQEKWVINPVSGDCNDYAVSKRHELLAKGWPSRALLLAEVVTSWGEHHLIVVVHTVDGDFVLDNLNPNIRSAAQAGYRWVRMQSPKNPLYWGSVQFRNV